MAQEGEGVIHMEVIKGDKEIRICVTFRYSICTYRYSSDKYKFLRGGHSTNLSMFERLTL